MLHSYINNLYINIYNDTFIYKQFIYKLIYNAKCLIRNAYGFWPWLGHLAYLLATKQKKNFLKIYQY